MSALLWQVAPALRKPISLISVMVTAIHDFLLYNGGRYQDCGMVWVPTLGQQWGNNTANMLSIVECANDVLLVHTIAINNFYYFHYFYYLVYPLRPSAVQPHTLSHYQASILKPVSDSKNTQSQWIKSARYLKRKNRKSILTNGITGTMAKLYFTLTQPVKSRCDKSGRVWVKTSTGRVVKLEGKENHLF